MGFSGSPYLILIRMLSTILEKGLSHLRHTLKKKYPSYFDNLNPTLEVQILNFKNIIIYFSLKKTPTRATANAEVKLQIKQRLLGRL